MTDREKAKAILSDPLAVGDAIERGVRASLIRHAKLGEQVVTWRHNKPCWVPARELVTHEELGESGTPTNGDPS